MWFLKFLLFHLAFSLISVAAHDPETKHTTADLISHHGYPVEDHKVITDDGYILTIYRIPNPGRRPVVLGHGLLDSSSELISTGPKYALGYRLYDKGFDVWLPSFRGSEFSKNHTTLSTNDHKFWDFSFHEMGLYDLASIIDYILPLTAFNKLSYVGYSLSSGTMMILLSLKPEYNNKIEQLHALGSGAIFGNNETMFSSDSFATKCLKFYIKHITEETTEFLRYFKQSLRGGCKDGVWTKECIVNYFTVFGWNLVNVDPELLGMWLTEYSFDGGMKTLRHVASLFNSGGFIYYDYGSPSENMLKYNSTKPPEYDLSKVTVPVYIQHAPADDYTSKYNNEKWCSLLPNCKEMRVVPIDKFNHFGFLVSVQAPTVVYDYVINILKQVSDISS